MERFNVSGVKNLVMDPLEHVAELGLVDIDIVLLTLKNNLPILLLHLIKDDNIKSLAEMCRVENEAKRKDLINS